MLAVQRVTIVLADWCPHCVPLSLDYAKKLGENLRVPLRVLDIDDSEQEAVADRLVENYGDYVEDYIIPQVFLEYDKGKVEHIFTGFSEGVSVTEARWISFFKSKFYDLLLKAQKAKNESLTDFVAKHMTFDVKCRGHCDAPASFRVLLGKDNGVVGAYCCPDGFVSRVIYFSIKPDLNLFYDFLTDQLGREMVERRDLRLATRHGWELSEQVEENRMLSFTRNRFVIKEVYWTRYARTDVDKSKGVFICSDPRQGKGCGKLFIQEITSKNRLCPKCR